MKRVGFIYEKVCNIENIKLAILKASIGKRTQNRVKKVLENIDEYATEVQRLLQHKRYKPSPYIIKIIHDGANKKERTICKPRFYPDQIIHWALMLQLEPIIMRGMYTFNCGSVPKRGTSYGQKAVRKWLDKDRKGTKYCLKMDITKFYQSVDNDILKAQFRKNIKDADCLWLIDTIIDSAEGLPIGNYTSQWFANYFLQDLDHYIMEKLKPKHYIRYVDDMVILDGNKRKLRKMRAEIESYLSQRKLRLKRNWQVFRVADRAIDFLGFRFFRDKTILRKRNALRIRRRISKISKKPKPTQRDASAVISYWGWIKRSDSYNFYNKYVKPVVTIKKAKEAISRGAKIWNNDGRRPDK